MVECYLCKGKLRVTRDKHVFDEKLKKRYHFKCFAGICRVCDMPVYTKSKHKVIGSNVWHEKCYKTKHRHNPATEEGVNKKLRQLSEELGKLKIGRHPGKKGASTEEGVTRKLHQLADELDKMHLGRKNPKRRTIEEEEAAIQFKRDFEDADMEEGRYDLSDPDSDASIDREARRETQEQGESEFWQDAIQAFSKGTKAFENWLKENVDTTKIDEVREKARRYFSKKNPKRRTIEEEEAAIQFKRDFEDADMEEGRYDLSDPDSDASIDREARRETQEQGESEFWQDAIQAFSKGTKAFENWLKENVDTTKIDEVREKARRYFSKKNPTLVTPELETDIVGAFKRVIHGMGTEADKALVRMAREADVVMSTGPSVLLKRNPEECDLVENPEKLDYIIQDEFGTTFETGKGTREQAEARALHYNQKHMRQFKVVYPRTESPEVKKAAQRATKEMLKS